jgi:hypothetical protein
LGGEKEEEEEKEGQEREVGKWEASERGEAEQAGGQAFTRDSRCLGRCLPIKNCCCESWGSAVGPRPPGGGLLRPCWLGRLAPWLLACCVAAGGKKKTAAGGKCVRVALPRWRGMDGGGGRAELRRRLSLPACSKLAAGARSLRSGRWVVVHGLAREGRRGEETAAFHRAGRVNRGGGINQQHLYLHAW